MQRKFKEERKEDSAHLARNLLGAALPLRVGLLSDPLAALVGVGERVPRLLVEEGVRPRRPRLRLVVDFAAFVRRLLARSEPSAAILHGRNCSVPSSREP